MAPAPPTGLAPAARALATALAVVAGAGPAQAQTQPPIRWVMTTEYPRSNISGEGIAEFARLAGERSGGRLAVVPSYDGGSGITSAQMLPAVRDGRIQAADAFAGPLDGVDPVFAIASLPFVVRSFGDAERLAAGARDRYRDVLARNGAHLLYITIWPPTGLWSRHPVAEPADLRGLSVRAYDANSQSVLRLAGADAVNLPFGQAIARLKAGQLDAILSSGDGGAGRQLWDDLPNFTAINYAIPVSVAFVQSAAFDGLPPDLQAAVDGAAAETEAHQWRATPLREDQNYARMRANHVAIRDGVSPELRAVFTRAARDTVDAWRRSADAPAAAILDRFERP